MTTISRHRDVFCCVIRIPAVCLGIMIFFLGAYAQPQDQDKEQLRAFKKMLHDFPVSQTAKELSLISSFPQVESQVSDTGLWGARYIESDEEGNIFVSDSRAHRVLAFNRSGGFLRQIGRKGQAPGEFISPRGIVYDGNALIVNDTGNHRIQFFKKSGTYIGSFRVYKTYYEIAANDKGLIFAAPIRLDSSDPLIDVFNHEGKIQYSFGTGKEYKSWQQLNWIKMAVSADGIFVVFQSFPILRVYSLSGELRTESNFGRGFMKEQERINLSREKKQDPAVRSFIGVVQDIKQKQGKVLVLVSRPRTEILELDKGGQITESWWTERPFGYLSMAFSYDTKSSDVRFYILQLYPNNIIEAYQPANLKDHSKKEGTGETGEKEKDVTFCGPLGSVVGCLDLNRLCFPGHLLMYWQLFGLLVLGK